ncbi:hypothetical protein [Streptomyces sp. NPDC012746]|uniref:hypothetical protein n=1 Tax=Streptomyces sp. NPDC012746 TaxID=3364845 RepID=UPI00368B0777
MTAAVCALARDLSPETLARHGFTTPATAHQAARCAALWAAEENRRRARAALDRHADEETPR